MKKDNIFMDDAPVRDFYEELMDNAGRDDSGSRLRAASMIMERCGDKEMSDTLGLLSAQMDFDDNKEACAAIERTRAKLDSLIADREAHHSRFYIKKLRDCEILELSNGEVTAPDYDELESRFNKNGLFDPDIFGGSGKIPFYDDKNDKMLTTSYGRGLGHIQLPVHVVLGRDYSTISWLLGINRDDVEKVAKYAAYLVLEPGESGLKKHALLNEKDYQEHKDDKGLVADMGGNAIHDALKGLGYGDEPERLAFSVLPVISPKARPVAYSKEEDTYYRHPINDLYVKVVFASNRCRKLAEIGAPDIILRNESRMLDDAVGRLADAAGKSIEQTHWTKSDFHRFLHVHINLILRNRSLGMKCLTEEELNRTDDIKSLDLFPKKIHILGSDSTELISLREVMDHNYDTVYNYEQENIIVLPSDNEEDLDDETKARIDEIDSTVTRMRSYSNDILSEARKHREECTVKFDEEEGMYMLAGA